MDGATDQDSREAMDGTPGMSAGERTLTLQSDRLLTYYVHSHLYFEHFECCYSK